MFFLRDQGTMASESGIRVSGTGPMTRGNTRGHGHPSQGSESVALDHDQGTLASESGIRVRGTGPMTRGNTRGHGHQSQGSESVALDP